MQRPQSLGLYEPRHHPVGSRTGDPVRPDAITLAGDAREVSAHEIASRYDIVGTSSGVVLLAERGMDKVDVRELGSTGQTNYGFVAREDYSPQWRNPTNFDNIDKMRRGDGTVRGTLRLMKTPITSARWFMQPASKSKGDRKIAQDMWKMITCGHSGSWQQFLQESLLFLDFGHYDFEKVFIREPDNSISWKYFSPRHPRDTYEWKFDAHGQMIAGVWYKSPITTERAEIQYPSKLLHFAFDAEGGDPTGISVLRSAYKHWYYKENLYKIDAIQKERHGIGIPVIKLPQNFNDDDKALAQEMGRNLRTNEKAHAVLPFGFELMMLKLEGQPVDALKSAIHHNDMIAMNILATFLMKDAQTVHEHEMNLFLRSLRYIAESVAETISHNAVRQIARWNYGPDVEAPMLKVRRIGDTVDWRTLSFAVRNLVGAGIITPDDRLEEWFRDEMDLSQWDPSTSRELATPHGAKQADMDQAEEMAAQFEQDSGTVGAPKPGLPRQSQARQMEKSKNTGKPNTGQDRSGG